MRAQSQLSTFVCPGPDYSSFLVCRDGEILKKAAVCLGIWHTLSVPQSVTGHVAIVVGSLSAFGGENANLSTKSGSRTAESGTLFFLAQARCLFSLPLAPHPLCLQVRVKLLVILWSLLQGSMDPGSFPGVHQYG